MIDRKKLISCVAVLLFFVVVDRANSEPPKSGSNPKAEATTVKPNNPFLGMISFKCKNNPNTPECVEFNKKAAEAKKRREAQIKFCAENPSDAECKAKADLIKAQEEKRKKQQELCKADPSKCNAMPFMQRFKSSQKAKK